MRLERLLLLAGTVTGIAACSWFGGGVEDARLRKSPNFQAGYEDGCAAATQQGADLRDRLVQDPTLYKTDATYRAGWSNGYSTCRTTNMPIGAQPGANPLNNPVPGH